MNTYDAIIIGGSFAGLSAAMQLARARRPILIIDGGQPRNRFAAHSHGVFTHDGAPGSELLKQARSQLAGYPTVSFVSDYATQAEDRGDHFSIRTEGGKTYTGKRLLLATGLSDRLPDLAGLAERWGKTVLHCPYCHGYEINQGKIGVLASVPMSVHQASIVADWGDVTLFINGKIELDDEALNLLQKRKVKIETTPVISIEGASPALDGLRLADGRKIQLDALFVAVQAEQSSPLAAQLGCDFDETPMGLIVRTSNVKLTSVTGVYAAGDAARVPHNITLAMADGVMAAMGVHQSLIAAEVAHA
jgi:thioredoxin reductase